MAENKIRIVTHNSKFHADDIFAVATLQLALNRDIEVVRSRDIEVIKTGDFVVDVGGVYDQTRNLFDHHQEGGAGKRDNGIPYASFGLVWKKYGEIICENKDIAEDIDRELVQTIDATDNGFVLADPRVPDVHPYTVGAFLNTFNPSWKSADDDRVELFIKAVQVARELLGREISKRRDSIEADKIVEDFYNTQDEKRLVVLDRYYPVSSAFISTHPELLYVIFQQLDGRWIIKAVSDDERTFIYRKFLPKSWAGKIGKDFEGVTGLEGVISCHNHLFIASAKTKEAILKLAEIALNY